MSRSKKVLFTVLLILFVGASVFMSFNMISRPTYEFEQKEDGWHFTGFNSNANITEVHIDHPMVKHSGKWEPDLSANVTAVDQFTFVSDEYVQYIYIGPTVTKIDEQAFVYCKQLRAVFVDDANPKYADIDGVLYTKDLSTILLYPICRCTHLVYTDFEQRGEVTNIGLDVKDTFTLEGKDDETLYQAFHTYCKNNGEDFGRTLFDEMLERGVMAPYIGTYYFIKERTETGMTLEKAWSCDEVYTVPEGVTRIAADAFYKCDRLTAITLPSTVKFIGEMAFFKCYGTSMIAVPDGVEEIGNDAFSFCSNMRYVMYIPASVRTIGHHCFYKCDGLRDFYMGAADDSAISLGGRWQPRSDNAFKAKAPLWGKTRAESDLFNSAYQLSDRCEQLLNENGDQLSDAEKQALRERTDALKEAVKGTDTALITSRRDALQAQAGPLIERVEQAAKSAAAQAAPVVNTTQNKAGTEINRTAMYALIIFVFIPGMLFIAVQVVRNLFWEEFLMTKRGKARYRKQKELKEQLHKEYLAQMEHEKEAQAAQEDAAPDANDEKGGA
ncbi:MAG: leucine-rich repeat protein [Clostridia bacterium]|nr:leucine-rich repeat protein [Clostridia bacterium]